MTWRKLGNLVRWLTPGSALHRSMNGEAALWGPLEYLAAAQLDALNGANWQRSGGKSRKPKQTPRPGLTDASDAKQRRFTGKVVPLSEIRDLYRRQRAATLAAAAPVRKAKREIVR